VVSCGGRTRTERGDIPMFLPEIQEDKCINCQACARICPKMVLEGGEKDVTVSLPSFCTGCESCSAVCPQKAIRVKEI
jgi:Pyruvate/2-oxoacid:ferredoxin oxidoreductase delta subunit